MKTTFKNFFRENLLIILVGLAFVVNGVIYAVVTPLWQNHDEIEHFAYTYFLAEQKKMPPSRADLQNHWDLVGSSEFQQAEKLLQSRELEFGVWQQFQMKHQDFSRLDETSKNLNGLSAFSRKVDDAQYKNPTTNYSPLYYMLETIPYFLFYKSSIMARAVAMRIFSVCLVLLAIIFSYRAALLIFKSKLAATTVATLIGFIPAFSYTSAGVNNDALIILTGSLIIYLLLRYLLEPMNFARALLIGLVFGIGLLSKPQYLAFTLPMACFWLYKIFTKKNKKSLILFLFLMCLVAILVTGPWLYYKYVQSGTVAATVGANIFRSADSGIPSLNLAHALRFIVLRYLFMYSSFFYATGCCHEMTVAPLSQALIGTVIGLAFLGFILFIINIRKNIIDKTLLVRLGLLALFPVTLEAAYLFIYLRQPLMTGVVDFPIDGRYHYPVISAVTILLMVGLQAIIPKKVMRYAYPVLVSSIVIINYINLLFTIIPRFYL